VVASSKLQATACSWNLPASSMQFVAPLNPHSKFDALLGGDVNVGDIVVEDGDIFGDGVNVAARLEGLAEPGGICVSARVQEDASGRLDLTFDDLGDQSLKNIARPIRVYQVRSHPAQTRLDQSRIGFRAVVRLIQSGQHQLGFNPAPLKGDCCTQLNSTTTWVVRCGRRDIPAQQHG